MRRHVILVLVALLATAALVSAQEQEPTPDSGREEASPPTATMHMVNGAYRPLTLKHVEDPTGPLANSGVVGSDLCSNASENSQLDINEGGTTDVLNFTALGDPVLSCMWGSPLSDRGFRTAWYEFTPSFNGLVTLSTQGSNYDTVLAVYTGECGTLTQLACNDDSNFFTSRIDLQVQAGKRYYVEVADWQFGIRGDDPVLNMVSLLQPSASEWVVASTNTFRSRHAVVADGTRLYIIAGQTVEGASSRRTGDVFEFDTANGSVSVLPPMPGPDGFGYSNTTAALVNGKIYMPAGFVGVDGEYDSTHWGWEIGAPQWETETINDWADRQAAVYSQATPLSFGDEKGTGYFLSAGLTGRFPESNSTNGWQARPELYFYSTGKKEWFQLDSMPTGRFGHEAALQMIDGKEHLCVAGGIGKNGNGSRQTLASTACYDPYGRSWSEGFAPLTYARYFASSAVDSRGNWYVFGGYNESGNTVPFTERYDPNKDEWIPLLAPYNVGNASNPDDFANPPRAWSRGAFVGDNLWIVGGETKNQRALPIVQWVELVFIKHSGTPVAHLPLIIKSDPNRRYDTFQTARTIPFPSSITDRFYGADDYVNIYDFVVPASQNVNIKLIHLAAGNWLDLVVYDDNKLWIAEGKEFGTANENITRWLPAGRYFVAVKRILPRPGVNPTSAQYQLSVGPG